MAIKLPAGFIITAAEPIDNRLVLTKAEMLAVKKGAMPDKYICLCKDDKRLYIYDKSIETPDPVLGRFKHAEDFFDFTSGDAQAVFEAAISNSATFNALVGKVGDAEAGTGLAGDVAQLNEDVEELKTDVSTLETEVADLKEEVEDPESGLMKRIQELESRATAAETRMTEIEARIAAIKLDNIAGTLTGGTATE